MLLTVEEAKKKMCPFAGLTALVYISAGERLVTESDKNFNCTGYECMGWRWASDDEYDGIVKKGFCGLAGRVAQ